MRIEGKNVGFLFVFLNHISSKSIIYIYPKSYYTRNIFPEYPTIPDKGKSDLKKKWNLPING